MRPGDPGVTVLALILIGAVLWGAWLLAFDPYLQLFTPIREF